jgi:hypothetical protein
MVNQTDTIVITEFEKTNCFAKLEKFRNLITIVINAKT